MNSIEGSLDQLLGVRARVRAGLASTALIAGIGLAASCSGVGDGSATSNPSGYSSGLVLTNAVDLNASGPPGGPFAPQGSYTLSNQGSQALQWSISASEPWIGVSATFGFLQVGESTDIVVTASGSNANSLPYGIYSGSVTISDMADSSADLTRAATLSVEDAAASGLSVTPPADFFSSGGVGGPFSPDSGTYTITNIDNANVGWRVVLSDPFVYVDGPDNGTLSSGQSVDVILRLDTFIAGSFGPGTYSSIASFENTDTTEIAAFREALLSVQNTVAGWTDLTPSADSRIIYMSSSGNDSNDGLSPSTPKRSPAAGIALLRDGFPDYLLFRRGDTWSDFGSFNVGGRSESERMVIGAWGPETDPRPAFRRSSVGTVLSLGQNATHLAVVSLELGHTFTEPYPDNLGQGLQLTDGSGTVHENILLEDLLLQHNQNGITFQARFDNLKLRRCIIADCYGIGLFMGANEATNTLLEECIFDRCGWGPGSNPGQSTQRRSMYITDSIRNGVDTRGCYYMRDSSGPQWRTGGHLSRNVHIQVPIANLGFLSGGGTAVPDGTEWSCRESLCLEANDIAGSPRGVFLQCANTDNGVLADNVVVHSLTSSPGGGLAFALVGDSGGEVTVGLHNVTVERNLVYRAGIGLDFDGVPGRLGDKGITNVMARDNHFESTNVVANPYGRLITAPHLIEDGVSFEDNMYYTAGLSNPFIYNGVGQNFANWSSTTGDDGTYRGGPSSFTDPNRGYSSYRDLVEGASGSTVVDFANELRAQRKGNWRSEYETMALINYVRGGFDLAPLQ